MKNKKVNVYVVHGYTSASSAEWFPWLKNKLTEIDISTTIFDMPNPNDPKVNEWDAYLDKNIVLPCLDIWKSNLMIGK